MIIPSVAQSTREEQEQGGAMVWLGCDANGPRQSKADLDHSAYEYEQR